jgi:Recombination endonuclease VII
VGAAVSTRAHSDEKPDQQPDEKRNEKSDPKWYEQDPVYQNLTRVRRRAYYESHKLFINRRRQHKRATDPDYRDKERARRYGLTLKDYRAIVAQQGNACAICRRSDRPLVVDHCHVTKKVRRLLCNKCNVGLGCFKDDPRLLRAAAAYLEAARGAYTLSSIAAALSSIAASSFGVTMALVNAARKRAIEEKPLQELAAYWGLAAIILVPIGLALIAWLLPGKD